MSIEDLEKELKIGNLNSIYLLYGEELFLLETCLKKIRSLFGECIKGINYIVIDEQNVLNIISDIETPSFGYEKKLIIAKNTGLFKKEGKKKTSDLSKLKEKLAEYIKENINIIEKTVVLVFIEDEVDEKLELCKLIDKKGVKCKFDFQTPIQIEKRIKAICNSYKVQIDISTVKYFIECCGTNMQELINEIRKLIEYVEEGGTIKKQDIDLLTIKKLESVIFELTDNLGKKDIKSAVQILQNIYAKEPIPKIIITLYKHFRNLYLTKIALNMNKDLITSLNLTPNKTFLISKYKMQARYFEESELRAILQGLCDLDYDNKSGKIDLKIGLETVICRYCSVI